MQPTREQAWEWLKEYTKSEALRRHALTVEGCMRHFAALAGEDAELWGVVGLLHDLDYEQYPDEHCTKVQESRMEKTLYAIDELTGLITAAAIMRPSKSVMDLELKSVKKKYKTPSFAAGVNRAVVEQGAQRLGATVDELITQCILGMRECAPAIGLAGDAPEA